ncbi:MAG: hypothetical protein ACREJ4_02260, partial [Candidatus Methylomirabilaceae bacterium]
SARLVRGRLVATSIASAVSVARDPKVLGGPLWRQGAIAITRMLSDSHLDSSSPIPTGAYRQHSSRQVLAR